jgi:hypothetical protein
LKLGLLTSSMPERGLEELARGLERTVTNF